MERNYQEIQRQFGEDKLEKLMELLNELKKVRP